MTEDVLAIARATLDRIRAGGEPPHRAETKTTPRCEKSERSEESHHEKGLISHNSLFSHPVSADSAGSGAVEATGRRPAKASPERLSPDLTSPHAMFDHTLAHQLARRTPRPKAERLALASGAVAWVMHHAGDHERIEQALARVVAGADAREQLEQFFARQQVKP